MIEIQDLSELTTLEIKNLLLEETEQPFSIYVPKETSLFNGESIDIAMDYAYLAFAGQELHAISTTFSYEEVSPEDHSSVLFELSATEIEKLADILFEISCGYVNDHPDEDFIYTDLVQDFLSKVENSELIPVCPYFIDIYNEYLAKANEDEEDID